MPRSEGKRPLWLRLMWLIAIWSASVLSLGVLSYLLRQAMRAVGLSTP
ncbi:DUF2474 domain-containing protein [Achromobacter anxifer]|nr:DUF2474 domain-containing protein [Achromobacter anxifer]MDF8361294.1 DUF2474 domain-containing protein [Achromobacter anxifer]